MKNYKYLTHRMKPFMTIGCKIEKCLFNSDDDVVGEIIKTIEVATSSIYVMHFWFSWKPIADALIDAHKKGVQVNVLTDQRSLVKYMQDNQTTYSISVPEYLSDNGIERLAVYFNHLMHHKIIIADDVLITGSLNLFKQSIHQDTESIIFIKSEDVCEFYKKEFESIFKNALDFQSAMNATKDQPRD